MIKIVHTNENVKKEKNYNGVIESNPNYLYIFYNCALVYKRRLKNIF
jgi:hypothetical protein